MLFAATLASVMLATGTLANGKVFSFEAVNTYSGSAGSLYGAKVIAAGGSLFLNYPNNATCHKALDRAMFYLQDSALKLYEHTDYPPELWVDRSGMGQGVLGYTVDHQQPPSNSAERTRWGVVDNMLQFEGYQDFYACPSWVDSYALWLDVGYSTPGNQDGCIQVALLAVTEDHPVSCRYTSRPDE